MKYLYIFLICAIAFGGCEEIEFPAGVIEGKQIPHDGWLDVEEVSTATATLVYNSRLNVKFYYKSPDGTIFSTYGNREYDKYCAKLPLLKSDTQYTFYVEVNGQASHEKTFKTQPHIPAEAVDLGLSVKWASWNFGATSPVETGGYYRFGALTEVDYSENDLHPIESVSGTEKDIVKQVWGDHWRTPTASEFEELLTMCEIKWDMIDNVSCFQFTGPNGASIVLPQEGGLREGFTWHDSYGWNEPLLVGLTFYWTGTVSSGKYFFWKPDWLITDSYESTHLTESTFNHFGFLIRPIYVD